LLVSFHLEDDPEREHPLNDSYLHKAETNCEPANPFATSDERIDPEPVPKAAKLPDRHQDVDFA
jgi:hypothetical protein